jgi:hypothetical protein
VGNDFHVVVHLFSHSSLEVEELCKRAVDADGNADLSALFGTPVETTASKEESHE